MATRYIQKVNSLSDLKNLPSAGGIGIYGGRLYQNLNGSVTPLAVEPAFGNVLLVDGDNYRRSEERRCRERV